MNPLQSAQIKLELNTYEKNLIRDIRLLDTAMLKQEEFDRIWRLQKERLCIKISEILRS